MTSPPPPPPPPPLPDVIAQEKPLCNNEQRIHHRMPPRGRSYSPVNDRNAFPNPDRHDGNPAAQRRQRPLSPSLKLPLKKNKSKTKQFLARAFGRNSSTKLRPTKSFSDVGSIGSSGYFASDEITARSSTHQSASLFRVRWADEMPAEDHGDGSSLDFPSSDSLRASNSKQFQLCQTAEFERVPTEQKGDLWYCSKQLKKKLALEIEYNKQCLENYDSLFDDSSSLSNNNNNEEGPDDICLRGLEHIFEGDNRRERIQKFVRGILQWHDKAKSDQLEDPEELRVVCKARTKGERTRAQKRGAEDASYIKKLYKVELKQPKLLSPLNSFIFDGPSSPPPSPNPSPLSRKKILAKLQPKLNWSPRPDKSKRAVATATAASDDDPASGPGAIVNAQQSEEPLEPLPRL